MNSVWLVWWNNGWTYDDLEIKLVSVCTDPKIALDMGKAYDDEQKKDHYYAHAFYYTKEVGLNVNLDS